MPPSHALLGGTPQVQEKRNPAAALCFPAHFSIQAADLVRRSRPVQDERSDKAHEWISECVPHRCNFGCLSMQMASRSLPVRPLRIAARGFVFPLDWHGRPSCIFHMTCVDSASCVLFFCLARLAYPASPAIPGNGTMSHSQGFTQIFWPLLFPGPVSVCNLFPFSSRSGASEDVYGAYGESFHEPVAWRNEALHATTPMRRGLNAGSAGFGEEERILTVPSSGCLRLGSSLRREWQK